jgi:hypothetical protein
VVRVDLKEGEFVFDIQKPKSNKPIKSDILKDDSETVLSE